MSFGFNSIQDYFRFVGAKEFWSTEVYSQKFDEKNLVEIIGDIFVYAVHRPTDGILKNIKSPAFIVSAAFVASAAATYVFYPEWSSQKIVELIPWSTKITPELLRKIGFIFTETTILGYTLRSVGRLCNTHLRELWSRGELTPVYIGGEVVAPPPPQ